MPQALDPYNMTPEIFKHLKDQHIIPKNILSTAENAQRHLESLVKELIVKVSEL